MKKLLVIRFSALGDVAMLVPVLRALALQHPTLDITMLSQPMCASLFKTLPANVHFVAADLKGKHKGIGGLNALLNDIDFRSFDYVADCHDVLRTKWLRLRCKLAGKQIATIDKGRSEKKALTRENNKQFHQLKSSFERYADVFASLGFSIDLKKDTTPFEFAPTADVAEIISADKQFLVGIAPFAKHKGKIYPLEKMERVVELLAKNRQVALFFFGFGPEEKSVVEAWCEKYPNTISLIGKFKMEQELAIMTKLDCVLSMDSANMHLASLVGTPVVSVWGATHPFAGFMGWQQSANNAVQLDLSCRPCSVFGDKPCLRGDYACMNELAPELIVEKIEANYGTKKRY